MHFYLSGVYVLSGLFHCQGQVVENDLKHMRYCCIVLLYSLRYALLLYRTNATETYPSTSGATIARYNGQ